MIRPIDRSSVHRICSGQVVLSLSSAIKELVENSLDAGATLIEVKTVEHGSEVVEVCDNGSGVKESDFQSLTLKHHTSKIQDFSDVASVDTFGFRGEALSSLCAVSDLEIVTCHTDSSVGTALTFDHNGGITRNTQTHRTVGTTVRLLNLFATLPVRHREFQRHVRREFSRAVQLLSAYCLVCLGKRIVLLDRSNGKKNVVLSTNGSLSYKDNISCLYGQKQVESLLEISGQQLSKEVAEEFFLPPEDASADQVFKLEGFVSSSSHGSGRSSSDRQFYFVNGRPCDLPKVSKIVNEVYRTFNKHQYPFVFLNVVLNEGNADVNVTPDKRQIFISHEKVLLALVKSTLLGMYEKQPAQMPTLNFLPLKAGSLSSSSTTSAESSPSQEINAESLKRKLDSSSTSCDVPSLFLKSARLNGTNSESRLQPSGENDRTSDQVTKEHSSSLLLPKADLHGGTSLISKKNEKVTKAPSSSSSFLPDTCSRISEKNHFKKFLRTSSSRCESTASGKGNTCDNGEGQSTKSNKTEVVVDKEKGQSDEAEVVIVFDEKVNRARRSKTLDFSMDMLRTKIVQGDPNPDEECSYRKFRSRILPTDNGKAEEELKKEIRKEDFSKMEVIGQFNLGFVVVRLREDLFIVDQHASDEKYNFEQLRAQEQLQSQPLVHPLELQLSAASEAVLLEHEQVFHSQGFQLQVDPERPVGRRARLVACPLSRTFTFGQEDIEELIFLLTDNPVRSVRPSRVNQMFASRACRKSVMVGTPLTKPLMRKLIQHMGEIEQPWNCPHGRPTMRHLFNLKLLKS